MSKNVRVLIVEDSEDDARLVLRELARSGYELEHRRVESAAEMQAALDQHDWDVVLGDYSMPSFSGPAALAMLRERGLDTPFIFVSGTMGEDTAVAAMRSGAQDYVLKGNLRRLAPAVERELREAAARAERRRLEERLRQSQKMEAIGQLAGGIAHDFNNLLTVVLGVSELLLVELPEGDPTREALEEIHDTAELATLLSRQLLAFSRQQILEPRVLGLNRLVGEVHGLLRRLIGEHIEVRVRLGPGVGAVEADPGQLSQVLLNLAVNARDAMPEGGSLTIETTTTVVEEGLGGRRDGVVLGEYVVLAVADTGTGMAAEVREHLFEPFFTTKERGKGTGLGLATCHGIVTRLGGHIEVDSELGAGTTMKVCLPRAQEEGAGEDVEAGPVPGGTETILLVEDGRLVRAVAKRVLTAIGYKVLEASDGPSALELLREHRDEVDLLLTDVVLPRLGGRQVAEEAIVIRPGIKVLFVSGYTDDIVLQHRLDEREVALLQKPFTRESLARKVRAVLDGAPGG